MKRIYTFILIIPAFLFSCDKIEDANTVEFDATLSMEIPVAVTPPAAMALKSTEADFQFSKTSTTRLSEITEIQDYLSKIEKIDINDIEIVFDHLDAGEEIKTIDISVAGVGVLVTLTNVTSSNNQHNPEVDSNKLMQVATILSSTKEIVVTVSGTASEAPMSFTVNMDFDCHIEAKAL